MKQGQVHFEVLLDYCRVAAFSPRLLSQIGPAAVQMGQATGLSQQISQSENLQ